MKNSSNATPIYRRLTEKYREEIRKRGYQPNERFCSERELVTRYGISRVTANKIISNLVSEGLLTYRPGIGTFVAPATNLSASLREMESFTASVKLLGLEPSTQVLAFRTLDPAQLPAGVADLLHAGAHKRVHYVERLRLADGEPVILEFRWINAELVARLEERDMHGSFYALMAERGVSVEGEDHQIHAQSLTAEEARRLHVPEGSAALAVAGRGYTARREPLWYQMLLYRGDRYVLENSINTGERSQGGLLRFKAASLPSSAAWDVGAKGASKP